MDSLVSKEPIYFTKETTNRCEVVGTICDDIVFSHEMQGICYYKTIIRVARHSENCDYIPLMISEKLLNNQCEDLLNRKLYICGEWRSYNKKTNGKNKLILFIAVNNIVDISNEENTEEINIIYLNGFLCKEPVYRLTPKGKRIVDIVLAVNRDNGKSDYIPCIAWKHNVNKIKDLPVGTNLQIVGRIQSRIYMKKIDDNIEPMTAYEISISDVL